MHIPSTMLNGAVCPVTLVAAGIGVGLAAYLARKSPHKPTPVSFAAVTALVFALQMMNYPVANGTSGHLVGAVLAVGFLGVPFAVLAMTVVLLVQAFLFGDGGLNALGANVLNMALIGAGAAGYLHQRLTARGWNTSVSLAASAWLSVLAAAAACAFEAAWAGAVSLNKALPAMLSVHALIGAGEAILTLIVIAAVNWAAARIQPQALERSRVMSTYALAVLAAVLSPLASAWPDGLEWVAGQLAFSSFAGFSLPVLFADYQASWVGNEALGTLLAGLTGMVAVSFAAWALARALRPATAR